MIPKILSSAIIVGVIIVSASILFSQQYAESNQIPVYQEKINVDWNNEATRILPQERELGEKWTLMWSDGSENFVYSESPIMVKKTVAGKEVYSTSYQYTHQDYGTYQVLIWKGALVSNWDPNEAVNNILFQTDAKVEKVLEKIGLDANCAAAYYNLYGEDSTVQNDLMFAECAKDNYRIRVNVIEGEFKQETIENMVFLSNLTIGKI